MSRAPLLAAVAACMLACSTSEDGGGTSSGNNKKAGMLVFYNRVPKTGSTSYWHAIEDAANKSHGNFSWYGRRYRNKVKLVVASTEDAPGLPATQLMCDKFKELNNQGDGVYALHTKYIDFEFFCPGYDIRAQYINVLRDPLDRVISGRVYTQSCICKNIRKKPENIRGNLWCKNMITKQLRSGHRRGDPNHYCSWTPNELVKEMLAKASLASEKYPERPVMQWNEYLSIFCGFAYTQCRGTRANKLAVARKTLRDLNVWIGILEQPEDSMRLLRASVPMLRNVGSLQHFTHKGDVHQANKSHGVHSYGKLDTDVFKAAKKLLVYDYELYDYAVTLLAERTKNLSSTVP